MKSIELQVSLSDPGVHGPHWDDFRLVVTNRELCKQARCYSDHAGSIRPISAGHVKLKISRNMELQKGQFIEYDGVPAVVVGLPGDSGVPDDHVSLWFGNPNAIRKSQGGNGEIVAEIWTVPIDLCEAGRPPIVRH